MTSPDPLEAVSSGVASGLGVRSWPLAPSSFPKALAELATPQKARGISVGNEARGRRRDPNYSSVQRTLQLSRINPNKSFS